ncbi:MAG: DUF3164 family protein [Rhizobiaceae bacterium]|nr:DUF3164 family protein [Rhizobiaceae bacterium]
MTLEQNLETESRNIAYHSPLIEVLGKSYMNDAKGNLTPVELVKPAKKLEDDMVRKIIAFAVDLNDQISRFQGHCFEDIGAFEAILAEEYNASVGGRKGNMSLMSFDGCMKVQVQVSDLIDFGPELQIAKSLIDECLNEWTVDSRPEVQAIITRAFNTDKEGQVNRSDVFMLLRLDIDDKRWQSAMDAIRDAIRVVGSKTYIRFYQRKSITGKWQAITIDLAKAG